MKRCKNYQIVIWDTCIWNF